MLSSTSNSDTAPIDSGLRIGAPAGPWGATWTLALVLTAIIGVAYEIALRRQGFRANVVDDPQLWSGERDRLISGSKRQLALVGDSRMQLGFQPDTFMRAYPHTLAVQLAIDGLSPIATLADLAADSRFRGVVIAALTPQSLLPERAGDQQGWVDYYHQRYTVDARVNRQFRTLVQESLALANPLYSLLELARAACGGYTLPRPYYLTTRRDRSRQADYALTRVTEQRERHLATLRADLARERIPAPAEWLQSALANEVHIAAIENRGGRVVYVHFPAEAELLAIYEEHLPRTAYWDRLAERTRAVVVDCRDVPELRRFHCADASHMDEQVAREFTLALARDLVERGVLSP